MSATAKDMDQKFNDLDKEILADKPAEPEVEDAKLDQIDDLLAGGDGVIKDDENTKDENDLAPEDQDNAEDTQGEDDTDTAEDDPAEIDAKVDYDIEVPMPEEMESLTVGELKDRETNRQQRERKIEKAQESNLQASADLDSIVSTLAALGQLPQETRAIIAKTRQANIVRENTATLEVIPEWKDNKVFVEDHKLITDIAARYGYTPAEVRAATDHRLIHAFREFALLQKKIDGAKATPDKKINRKNTGRKTAHKTAGKKTDNLVSAAAKSDNRVFKDAAIAKLLE